MAQANNASNDHEYLYLLDAVNGRQYAVKHTADGMIKGVDVFHEDQKNARFQKNEKIFALDDEYAVKEKKGGIFLSATAYQINTDKDGSPVEVISAPVTYKVTFSQNPAGETVVSYQLTPPSVLAMRDLGFNPSFPAKMEDNLGRGIPPTANIRIVDGLFFPPHHNGKADVARKAFEGEGGGVILAEEGDPRRVSGGKTKPQGTAPTSPKETFNEKTADRPASPPATTPRRPRIRDAALESALKEFTRDMTAEASAGTLDPVIGREADVDMAIKVFLRRKQGSLCFTGEAGVGKSAMFDAIAARLVNDDTLPETLKSARLMLLDVQKLVAGTKYRGDFEKRMKPLIEGLQERGGVLNGRKVILAIDEIHSAMSSGGAGGGANNFGEMIKSFMQVRGISFVGTTTKEEYRKHIESNPALARRFERHHLEPTKREETLAIVKGIWPLVRAHHGLTADLTDRDFEYIVTMTDRYAPNEAQPSKSEKVLNLIGASAEFAGRTVIEASDILAAVSKMSGLSIDFLAKNDGERFLKMREELPKVIFGQPNIQKVISGLIGARSGLTRPDKPLGCFVLQGPTGTGKTEFCKQLALQLFGTEDALIRIDMVKYGEAHAVSGLIGAPPGYVGFDQAPALTEQIRNKPYSILLLDEIEKAHTDIFNILLPILDAGKVTDNHGNPVLFNNTIIVMTTNLGANEATALLSGGTPTIGFASTADKEKDPAVLEEELDAIYKKARLDYFKRPELIGRIEELGGFITFRPFTEDVKEQILTAELKKMASRLSARDGSGMTDVTLVISCEAKLQIKKSAFSPQSGARDLGKAMTEYLINPLAEWLLVNKDKVEQFVSENGPARLVISSVEKMEPVLEKAPAPVIPEASVSNDNASAPKAPQKKTGRVPKPF